MEMSRRVTQGLLSEAFGYEALDTDRLVRTLGFRRLAERGLPKLGPGMQDMLAAYTRGVNVCLEHQPLPVEFSFTGHQPRPWTEVDTVTLGKFMEWNLSHAWAGGLLRAKLIAIMGDRFNEIDMAYPSANPSILAKGIDVRELDPTGEVAGSGQDPLLQGGPAGSNSWVIPPSRSSTGHVLLANDMHLELRIPSIWYLAHLHTTHDDLQVYGTSLPGLPCVVVGHNSRIGWGATLGFADQQDLFVEEIHPEDPGLHRTPDGWRRFEETIEKIPVKGRAEPHQEVVRHTSHGPVLDRVLETGGKALALQAVPLQESISFEGFYELQTARNWDEFTRAVEKIQAPPLNLVYGDVEGNVGYWLAGKVPVRRGSNGRVPMPGWSGEHDWNGFVPFREMPHLKNPGQEIIVTANHKVIDENYPHFLGEAWMNGYRARRIHDVLDPMKTIGPEDCVRLMMDGHSIPGREFVTLVEDWMPADHNLRPLRDRLARWNAQLTADSVGGALYEVMLYTAFHQLLKNVLEDSSIRGLIGAGPHPLFLACTEFYGHAAPTLLRILRDPGSKLLADFGGRDRLLEASLVEAKQFLQQRLGPDVNQWTWGNLHHVHFEHAMSKVPALAPFFGLPSFPIGGDTDTVHQTAYLIQDPFDNNTYSPGFRQILDFSDFSRSRVLIIPGESGHPTSPHYGDLVDLWRRGDFIPMLWTPEEVDKETRALLTLDPV
jgi:penicillin amidase